MSDKFVELKTADGRIVHFSDALVSFAAQVPEERLELGAIIRFMERRSIGAMLLVFALPMVIPIPAPGISVLFGIPLIFVSAQLLLGRTHAWLPRRLATRSISRTAFVAFIGRALPALRRIERIASPRATWLAEAWAMQLIGATCLVMALIITLPIPLGHFVPGSAVSLLAIGLVERDGVLIGVGLLVSALGLIVITLASSALFVALQRWLSV